ncbi:MULTISPECIES: hypothetical protein [unclassified Lysobacter]|uniref:hypothetical protein n=1 Tax=unclassified Lysobacter TaxID=2635362 RepID=UPI001BE7D34C|nr:MULTISPECIES: hypothetical protein [unclassified Lysobacter]MBT2749308.1 hypothetical protein [Lysobacter sp. ISL-42]MBT2753108.1 hypothetical protein [Lysobacter sp. ISL-50]MBT2777277.1 hypothetical protein [Lysobacter sp. ISL-54]MBT2783257.1 hypothetical protein [Lysobacter sp. ISL-52]
MTVAAEPRDFRASAVHRLGIVVLRVEHRDPGRGDKVVAIFLAPERLLRLSGQAFRAAVVADHRIAARQGRQTARAQSGLIVQRQFAQFALGFLQQRARGERRAAQSGQGRRAQGGGE